MRRHLSFIKPILLTLSLILSSIVSAEDHNTNDVKVLIETNHGNIIVKLNPEKAPITVKNFLQYVDSGFYTKTVFHRVIPGFMIQGGGFYKSMDKLPTRAPIRNEATNGLHNNRGTIAMARTNDPHSASSQFFINVANNNFLDYSAKSMGYAVFGKVVEGMDVVEKIENVPTTRRNMHANIPVDPVVIKEMSVIK